MGKRIRRNLPTSRLQEKQLSPQAVSEQSCMKAKTLITQGLQMALQAPSASPEQVWAEFDAVRAHIQAEPKKSD